MHRFVAVLLFDPEEDPRERRERNQQSYQLKLYRRALCQYGNPFLLPPDYFRQFYRLYPGMAWDLALILEPYITAQGPSELHPTFQVLAALRFFAEGPFQKGVSQDFRHPTSQPTFSRCLNRVVNALCNIAGDWIKFPSSRQERQQASQRFLRHSPIPGILGLIDCFVVKIIRPAENEEAYFNFKHGHSLNVQVVCGENFVIYDLRICPGSNNDRYIWKYSEARHYMRSLRFDPNILGEEGNYYLLGDSGYTCSPILLTPVRNAQPGTPHANYTIDQCSTRCIVERLFGDLSNKYLSISRRRVLHYRPIKAGKIILSAAVLHNYEKYNGQRPGGHMNIRRNILPVDEIADYQGGLRERERLIAQFYNL